MSEKIRGPQDNSITKHTYIFLEEPDSIPYKILRDIPIDCLTKKHFDIMIDMVLNAKVIDNE